MFKKEKKAQSINEYALILGIVAVVLVSMQTYFKRSINSMIVKTADQMGDKAEVDWKAYYADRGIHPNILLPAQTIGAMEEGLIYYTVNDAATFVPLTSNTTTTFKLTENDKNAAVKTKNEYDTKTVFKGKWIAVKKFDSLGTFSINEKKDE